VLTNRRTTKLGGLRCGGFETVVPSTHHAGRFVADPLGVARRSATPQASWHPSLSAEFAKKTGSVDTELRRKRGPDTADGLTDVTLNERRLKPQDAVPHAREHAVPA
jgi:hypothetical protein